MLSWLSIFSVRSLASHLSLRLTNNSFSFKLILNFASKMRHPIQSVSLMEYLHLIHRGTVLQLLEPSTSVLPDIKVDRHYYWQDTGGKGNRASDTLLPLHFVKLLIATQRHRTSVWPSSRSPTFPWHALPYPNAFATAPAVCPTEEWPWLATPGSEEKELVEHVLLAAAEHGPACSCCQQGKAVQAVAVGHVPAALSWRAWASSTQDEQKAGQALAADWAGDLISLLVPGPMPTVLGC